MRKGISFYFGYYDEECPEKYARLISSTGFDSVITNADPKYSGQNGTIEEQIELFKKYNLKPSSLHSQYNKAELPDFWKDTPLGDKLEETLKQDILTAKKYGFTCVVVHMLGEYNKIGEARLLRVLDLCKETNIPLAIENISQNEVFFEIFKHIDNSYLKFCFDSGHNNCFSPEFDFLENYKDKLICLHLHDNMGKADEHTLNRFGTINWDKIAKTLASIDRDISLDYEMIMYSKHGVGMEECVTETFQQALELEAKILQYKNKN